MNDLLNTLYDYVLTQSESYLAVYPEYRDFCRRAAEKERSLRANLSQEDEQLLEDMLGELWAPASGGAGGRFSGLPGAVPGAEPCRLGVRPPAWAYCTPKSPYFIPKLCKAILPSRPWE